MMVADPEQLLGKRCAVRRRVARRAAGCRVGAVRRRVACGRALDLRTKTSYRKNCDKKTPKDAVLKIERRRSGVEINAQSFGCESAQLPAVASQKKKRREKKVEESTDF